MNTLIPVRVLERLYVGTCIICLSGALFLIFFENSRYATDAAANSFAQVLSIPAVLYAAFHILKHPSAFLNTARRAPLPALLCLLCFFSAAWSIDVSATLRRSVILSGLTAFGYTLSFRFSVKQICEIFCQSFIFIFAVSLIGALIVPSVAIHQDQHYPAVRGFFAQKNITGRVFLLGFIFALVLAWRERKRRLLSFSALTLCFAGIVASLSATAILDLAVVIALFVGALIWRRLDRPSAVLAIFGCTTFVCVAGYMLYDHLFFKVIESMGRDITLTGRTVIWEELYSQVRSRSPVVGFGYEAFWTADSGGTASIRWIGLGPYTPPQAHNGLIHAYTGMGVFGVIAFIYAISALASKGIRGMRRGKDPLLGTLTISFFAYFLVVNLAENEFLVYNSLIWVVFVCIFSLTESGLSTRECAK